MDKIKCLIFDMDNTLIDRQLAAWLAIQEIVQLDFPNKSKEDLLLITERLYIDDGEGHISKEDVYRKYIQDNQIKDKDWLYYNQLWLNTLPKYTILYPETKSTLEELKQKYRLALITNGDSESQRRKLLGSGLSDYFEEIIVSSEFKVNKPEPAIFLEMCKRMNVKPEECIYIGDALENDVRGSLAVGMKSIWVYPFVEKATTLSCQRIYRIQDLKDFL